MADISDVEQAFADKVTSVIYPQGPTQSSIVGATCRIYRGWPSTATLTSDLSAGVVNVTVTSDNDSGKTTTRYLQEWQYLLNTPTLSATVIGNTILVAGVPQVGNVIGALVNNLAFAYRVLSTDTTDLVASNLCSLMQSRILATANASLIRMPGATSIIARVVTDNNAIYEGRRQEKNVRVALWCPNPSIRDFLATEIDLSLAQAAFLLLPDTSNGRITYRNSLAFDQSQNALLYRRDLLYDVEYATTVTTDFPTMIFGAAAINCQVVYG